MSLRSLCILLPLLSVANSCALFSHSPEEPLHVQSITTIPETFTRQDDLKGVKALIIPDSALAIVKTTRNQVELREGPGLAFQLKDEVLPRDKTLIVIEKAKKWTKVFDPISHASGWVHQQTIQRMPSKGHKEVVALKALPKAFAVSSIKKIYDYKAGIPIEVNIPKGTPFIRLREDSERSLVIIPQTASLAWINKKDIQ